MPLALMIGRSAARKEWNGAVGDRQRVVEPLRRPARVHAEITALPGEGEVDGPRGLVNRNGYISGDRRTCEQRRERNASDQELVHDPPPLEPFNPLLASKFGALCPILARMTVVAGQQSISISAALASGVGAWAASTTQAHVATPAGTRSIPKAEHTAAPTNAADVKKVLANSEPSTHGGNNGSVEVAR